jgi:hypothetical protein
MTGPAIPEDDEYPVDPPEVGLGGADAVPKTTHGAYHGADVSDALPRHDVHARKGEDPTGPVAAVAPGGVAPVVWITGSIMVLAVLVYLASVLF